jgi:rhodanese-related sulfurtransferase
MKTLPIISALALALAGSVAQAADTPPASGMAPAPSAVSPANDSRYTYKTRRLNRAAFDALLSTPDQVLVLDIRRPDEVTKTGGFPAYLSIQTNDVQKSLASIPRNRSIVTVSNRAHRAGAVGDLLAANGFQVAGAIGVLDYEDEGGKLSKIVPPLPSAITAPPSGSQAR